MIGLANDVLTKMPELIDFESTQNILSSDPCPLNVVLLQEVSDPARSGRHPLGWAGARVWSLLEVYVVVLGCDRLVNAPLS